MRARAELRARRRATVALVLLTGIGGAGVLGAAAAARRTDSAYPRFLEAFGAGDLLASDHVGGEGFFDGEAISAERFVQMDGVVGAEKLRFYLLFNSNLDRRDDAAYLTAEARSAERAGAPIDEHKVIAGRDFDPTKADEAVLTLQGAHRAGLEVGDILPLRGVPDVFPDFAEGVRRKPLDLRIVGVVAVPGDFPPQTGDETIAVRLTPAFYERYPEQAFGFPGAAVLQLEPDPSADERFRAAYQAAGGNLAFTIDRRPHDANVQRSIHLQALALWALAVLGAALFLVILAQVIARQVFLEAAEVPALRALGFSRSDVMLAALARVLVPGVLGVGLAVLGAMALSSLFPNGVARLAEPSPGVMLDPVIVVPGATLILAVVAAIAALAAFRESARAQDGSLRTGGRPSRIVEMLARVGRAPAVLVGARLALQRGSGRSAMPVLSTLTTLVLGVAVFAAAGTFSSSMNRFLTTPSMYGVAWDARVGIEPIETFEGGGHRAAPPFDLPRIGREVLERDSRVTGTAIGITGVSLTIDDLSLEGLVIDPSGGDAPMPPLLAGRYPATGPGAPPEIVLGLGAVRELDVEIGDRVTVTAAENGRSETLSIVGVGVVPVFAESSRLGVSALLSTAGFESLGGSEGGLDRPIDSLFVRGAVDLEVIAEIAGPGAEAGHNVHIWEPFPPTDVVNFGRVQATPMVLGALLAAFTVATLLHTLLTAIGRRRRELGILKALGFVRAQVGRTVRAQALILALIALGIGIPLGIMTGRWLWIAFANGAGVVPEPTIPVAAVGVGIVGAVLLAMLLAIVPARIAACTPPAITLRAE